MAWGKKNLSAAGVGSGPFAANYNRAYDTHTAHDANQAFAVNPPDIADVGPHAYSGIGPDKQQRAYKNPTTVMADVNYPGETDQYGGYLGHTVGPREIQTGNAPSGGYTTLPGLGFAQGFQSGAIPDNRRITPRNRADDWEDNQAAIHERRDSELKYRRSLNVDEAFVEFDHAPTAGEFVSPQVNAIEDSPLRKDWNPAHSQYGQGGSATFETNPNRFRNFDYFDRDTDYRNRTRYMNGTHYSMAEHHTLDPYVNSVNGGSSVQQYKRNTYYMTPQPWDGTNTDGPANVPNYATVTDLTGGTQYGTSYRL